MSKKHKGKKFGTRELAKNPETRANQWQATQKQQDFLRYYLDPKQKETFGNSYQSAIKAGYSETYAKNIMTPSMAVQWVSQAKNIIRLEPEHLQRVLIDIATSDYEKASDKIQAVKLLGLEKGMFVQKQLVGVVNIEEALNELE
jgi:hypothetical protein